MVPVIKNVEKKGFAEIEKVKFLIKNLIDLANKGK